ncbi:kinetochore component rough deal [Aphomia sociella]
MNSIVTSLNRKYKSSHIFKHLKAQFLYPKLLLFENDYSIRIIDLKIKESDQENDGYSFVFESEIVDRTIQHDYLWLILDSGEINIIDLNLGFRLKIVVDNFINSKLKYIKSDKDENLYFIKSNGDCYLAPYTSDNLKDILIEDKEQLNVSLKKVSINHSNLESCINKISPNGLFMNIEDGNIVLKCPITGLYNTIISNAKLQYVVDWEEVTVLSDESNMWIVDLKESNILFQFDNITANYYPLASYNNILYYITWNESEVHICCAWNTTTELLEKPEDNNSLSNSFYKISSQESLKLQLKTLIETTVIESEPDQVMIQLQQLFEKINDYPFLVDAASKICQCNIVYKSILYPLQARVHALGDNKLVNLIAELIIKIDLLEYIHFRNISDYGQVNFFEKNFKQLCVVFISKSDLDLATICWLKYSELKITIDQDDIVDILNSIPYNIKMGALIIWLKNFVPALLDENPFFIDLIVKWTVKRVFELENSGYWPKIGIKFIEEITNVLELSLKTVSIRPISMDDVDMLKDHIIYIIELKEKYKINILLSELSSLNPNEVALIMLHRCYTEDLEVFLQDYLPKYAARHIFDMDDTLRSFIENEAASSGGGVDGIRLKILLNSIRSTSIKLDCLLQVLKVLDVPWNATVLDLAIKAAASATKDFTITDADRLLAQEIQKELNYANVKVVLKKYNFPLTCTDYMLLLHKLVNAPVLDLHDLKVVTSVMTTYKNYGHILYISRCLQDCDARMALHYFQKLTNNEKKILLKAVTSKFEQIINGEENNITIERNYLDFLKGTQMLTETEISDIEKLYNLKNLYNIVLNLNKLYNENYCVQQSSSWMIKYGDTASSGRCGCVTQLTCTDQSRYSMLMQFLRRSPTSHPARKLVESLISLFTFRDKTISENIDTLLSVFKDGENSLLLLESSDVLVELLTNCAEENLHYIINKISILNALINANIIQKNLSIVWKFYYIFLPMSSVAGINDLIKFYKLMSPQNKSVPSFERSDFIAFTMISSLMADSLNSGQPLNDFYYEKRDKIAQKIVTKILTAQNLDEVLLTGLLIIMSTCSQHKEIENQRMWISDILQGQNESLSPAVMGYLSSPLIRHAFKLDNNLSGSTASYPPQYILKCKFNINLAEFALPDSNEETWDVKVILFYVLRQNPETNYSRLVDLCRTLNVSINDGLSLQLIALLTTWELKYTIENDELDCSQIYFEKDHKEITRKCVVLWENIEQKEFLRDILNDFWKNGEVTLHGRIVSINPYYYEIYICIYHLIFGSSVELRNKKEYFLLNFLRDYRRISAPKQYEFELFSVKGMFPQIGHYRLPFHLFMREDMWLNLKSEITLETYEHWLPVVALLSLDPDLQTARDMICSNALKQTMTSRKHIDATDVDTKDSEPWRLSTREEPLLRAAHRCVRHIANMEWAGACLFYVLQGCARGADQVAAAQLCYQFAQRWAALQPGNRAVRQMERLHSTLSTRHALHKIEWACEEFVRLSTEPAQLIRAMYLHPNFVEKMSRHDVNRAANEIADKNAINISSIRIQILENILEKTNEEKKHKTFLGLDTKQLMTAKYILKATCPKMGAIYLSRIAFDDESDFNKCKKLRALQCLMSVIDTDTAVKVTNRERDALWSSLLELISIVNLENIDMPWVVATFMQDKMGALEQLLQSAAGNVDALKVAGDLARRFSNTHTIKNIIPLMLRAGLYEEMIPLLLKISSPVDDIIRTAWRAVILSPFQRADYPITERQKIKCLNAINLLPVSPVIKDGDLKEIWKNCIRCKCFGIGCLVLPYMTSDTRQTLTELKKIDKRNLIASLKNLHTETFLVSGAMYVIENMVFKTR